MNFKLSKQQFLAYMMSFFVIMSGAVMYNYIGSLPFNPFVWKALIIIICIISLFSFGHLSRVNINEALVMSIYLVIYALLSIVFSEPMVNTLITYVASFVLIYLYIRELIKHNRLNLLINAFSDIMMIITIISLFFWLFGSILKIIPSSGLHYSYGGGTYAHNFFWLYFDEPIQNTKIFGLSVVRNCGICTEAPGFANYLIVALTAELIRKHKKLFRCLIFILGLISNFSSKSFLMLVILAAFIGYKVIIIESKIKYKALIFIISVPMVFGIMTRLIYNIVIDKSVNSQLSYNGRVNSLVNAINAWLKNPLLGVGIANYGIINSGSMGITLLLAQCGLVIFVIYILAIKRTLLSSIYKNNKWEVLMFLTVHLANFFISNIGTAIYTIIIVSIGLSAPYLEKCYPKERLMSTNE